jgi:predicted TPR repeat methyltransferase
MNITADPNLPLIEAARTFIDNGQLAEAAAALNQARAQIPSDPRVYMMAGLMSEKAGNVDGAFQLMQQGLTLAPEWAPGIIVLAQLQVRQGQFPEASENAELALQLDSRSRVVRAGAIEVAHSVGALELAVRHLKEGLAQEPQDKEWRMLLANHLSQLGKYEEALLVWKSLVEESPKDQHVLKGRMHTLLAAGKLDEAALVTSTLLSLAPGDPIYTYYDARARGQTPPHQPAELNRALFDSTAQVFDQQLVSKLRYRLPHLTAQKILKKYPHRQLRLLDLGCGTGLLGAQLGKISGRLEGVDVSPKMLDQAKRLGLYDSLEVGDLHKTLSDTSAASYDIVAALEVFVYIGDLSEAIPASFKVLVPGGYLVFSCEIGADDGPDLYLDPLTERYVHKRGAVEALCRASGFVIETELAVLRYQKGKPVQGFVVWARKPS